MLKNCKYCQSPFEARRSNAEFCSPAHRAAYGHVKKYAGSLEGNDKKLKARIAELEHEIEILKSKLATEREYSASLEKELETGPHVDEPVYEPLDDGW